jgi:DNA mismatch repair protein MutL
VLSHNGKIIRQYRAANNKQQYEKRVAQVCGQAFVDNALYLDCQHESLHLHGWMATPDYCRKQNDLCYSYVNGRMMRDKLINHAIRQAYSDSLPAETYPAFVLFLTLNVKEVDVNVHPAKHEVRFHQSRYVHDFIFSVCQQTLASEYRAIVTENTEKISTTVQPYSAREQAYVNPIRQVHEDNNKNYAISATSRHGHAQVKRQASQAYQNLMTPLTESQISDEAHELTLIDPDSGTSEAANNEASIETNTELDIQWLTFIEPNYVLFKHEQQIRLISIVKIAELLAINNLQQQWEKGLVSQPLLLPIKFQLSADDSALVRKYQEKLTHIGIVTEMLTSTEIKIRQFPALLRQQNISECFTLLCQALNLLEAGGITLNDQHWQQFIAQRIADKPYQAQESKQLWQQCLQLNFIELNKLLRLNSADVDLTSIKKQLT